MWTGRMLHCDPLSCAMAFQRSCHWGADLWAPKNLSLDWRKWKAWPTDTLKTPKKHPFVHSWYSWAYLEPSNSWNHWNIETKMTDLLPVAFQFFGLNSGPALGSDVVRLIGLAQKQWPASAGMGLNRLNRPVEPTGVQRISTDITWWYNWHSV